MGAAPKRGTGADGGKQAVVMTIQKAPGTNTLVITERIDGMLDELKPSCPPGSRSTGRSSARPTSSGCRWRT